MKFYKCRTCGNLLEVIYDGGNSPVCCGKTMELLRSESTDGAKEKHVPIYGITECQLLNESLRTIRIHVGEEAHPMSAIHRIEWIVLETDCGVYRKNLQPEVEPVATFCLKPNEQVLNIYAYCNLHGLFCKTCDVKAE